MLENKELIELFDAIESILGDIAEQQNDKWDDDEYYPAEPVSIEIITDGFDIGLACLGHHIWSTTDDDRTVIDPDNEDRVEPFEPFLRRKLKEIIQQYAKYKI